MFGGSMQENPVKGSIKCVSENMLPTISSRIKKKKAEKFWIVFDEAVECEGNPVNIFSFNVNNRNTRRKSEIHSTLIINTPEQCHRCRSGVFNVNFEHISYLVSIADFEQVLNVSWEQPKQFLFDWT